MLRWFGILMLLGIAGPPPGAAGGPPHFPAPPPGRSQPAPRTAGRDHWAFQPITHPNPPGEGHPVDAFIRAALATHGLQPSPAASARDLVRRVTFDLVGLPPTPREIDDFERDPAPDRFERLVDRLLARPQYGERWGRHWLDAARFTESTGFEYDRLRDHAWPYRDYVIRSFNEDKPYDRFVREQIAGDVLEPVTIDGLLGPSLLVCGPYDQAGNSQANATQRAITREEELEDLVGVVGQTFLGLTLNCARCHDHKFDPIPLPEYYRIKSVFDGVQHGERPLELPAVTREREALLAAARHLAESTKSVRDRLAAISVARAFAEPEPEPPAPGPWILPDASIARLGVFERAEWRAANERLAEAQAAIAVHERPTALAYAGRRVQPSPTRVLRRGDVKSPGDVVAAGALSALAALPADFGLPADAPEAERRRRFADWLTDPRNPLPARVMVNRIWQHHFGQGLVTTPNDFGASGARPSHPELLDWLAGEFVRTGWSVKALHRRILTSATYRQSSAFSAAAAAVDADNQFLWRYAPRRLEAEAVRDAMLAVAGQLNPQVGGPSFRPFTMTEFNAAFYHPFDDGTPEFNRRTVYRMNVNSGKDPFLDVFDCPDPSVKVPRRGVTTTPLQALELMNSSFVQRQSRQLAERARALAGDSLPAAITAAYRLALGRAPSGEELAKAVTAANERGLASLCWALLNSTEFLHVL